MTTATIKAKNPVREDFAGCSTGNGGPYYPTKGDAVSAYSAALAEYGLCFDCDDLIDIPGDEGRVAIEIWTDQLECAICVGSAIIAWHRMSSGRYEFTGYIT